MCAQVAPSGECLRGKGPPDRMLANLGAVCLWQPIPSGLNLFVAAVLRDKLCRVIAALHGRLLYVVYRVKVERFVLTIIKQRLLLLLSVGSIRSPTKPSPTKHGFNQLCLLSVTAALLFGNIVRLPDNVTDHQALPVVKVRGNAGALRSPTSYFQPLWFPHLVFSVSVVPPPGFKC